MVALGAKSGSEPTGYSKIIATFFYLLPQFILDPIDMKIVKMLTFMSTAIENQ